jgi:hypothetical protein
MGKTLPPPPLNKIKFRKRWNEGKRTLAELDPVFWQWHLSNQRYFRFQKYIILLGLIGIIAILIMVALSK